jgi:hypothetical protein
MIKKKTVVVDKTGQPGSSMLFRIFRLEEPFSTLIFIYMLGLPVYWVLRYQILPIQDLPCHVANAAILSKFNSVSIFQQSFSVNYNLYPYLLQDLLLMLLLPFGSDLAIKIFAAITIVSIPLSLFYLIRTTNPGKSYLAFFALPFAWNMLFLKGTFNFLLGISIAFICLTLLWQILFIPGINKRKKWALFLFWFFALYLAHLVAFVLFFCLAIILLYYKRFHQHNRFTVISACAATFGVIIGALFNIIVANSSLVGFSSILIKFQEIGRITTCYTKEDCFFYVPVLICLFILSIIGFVQNRKVLLPFLLCLSLVIGYFLAPTYAGPLVRPHERIFYMLLFLLPICCTNRIYTSIEKGVVIILCSAITIQAYSYFTQQTNITDPLLEHARAALDKVPQEKKLMAIWSPSSNLQHIDAYYVIDRNGYVPSLFSAPYMIVQYLTKPVFSYSQKYITLEMLRKYDYLFVSDDTAEVEARLNNINFTLFHRENNFGIYKNLYVIP